MVRAPYTVPVWRADTVMDALLLSRLQFAFTITYHYLFPQLTMGLAPLIVYWKWRALRTGDERFAPVG